MIRRASGSRSQTVKASVHHKCEPENPIPKREPNQLKSHTIFKTNSPNGDSKDRKLTLDFKDVKPVLQSRASPPPADDFDLGASEDAKAYAAVQRNEEKRRKVKEENVERHKRGERKLKMPPKIKEGKKRRRSTNSSSDDDEDQESLGDDEKDDELAYDGQVVLNFNPLPVLSRTPVDDYSFVVDDDGVIPPSEDEEEGVEVYDDDDDDYVVTPWHCARRPVAPPEEVDDLEAQEEIYSEDEDYSAPSTIRPTAAFDRGPVSDGYADRPAFPFSHQQAKIGPLRLDKEDPTIFVPASINRFLRSYQRIGASFLYSKYKKGIGGVLGDDMGLGKTVQVIAFLSAIMRKTGTVRDDGRRKNLIRANGRLLPPKQWATALIVCPTSLVDNWKRELDTWGYFEFTIWRSEDVKTTKKSMRGGYLDIILVSHDLVHRDVDDLKDLPFSTVIVDEAHRLKNHQALLALAVKKISRGSCFALTGTLVQNRMEEMWSILDTVHRGWAGTRKEWKTYVVSPITQNHRHGATVEQVVRGIQRAGEVHALILPHFYLRRDKGLIAAELPRKRDLVVLCPLARRQGAVYKRIIESEDVAFILQAKEPCECGSGKNACCHQVNSVGDDLKSATLKMFDALGRVANHLALLYHHADDSPQVKATNKRVFKFCTGQPYDPAVHNIIEASTDPDNCGKWTLLHNLLIEWRTRPEDKNKVLVFSNSVRLLKMIATFIEMSEELSGFDCEVFSGSVDKKERMEMVDRFQDPDRDSFVMLVSTAAGGVGLNLTAANKVVIFDPNWNPAADLQAMDRAFRIGQKRDVDIYRLVAQGTIEEVMYERQIYKQQRARQMNDGTFERRTHIGYEGAKDMEGKGELFGVHNIFRYEPEGFVKGNLQRIRDAEDQVRQDLLDAEDSGSEEEDEESKLMRKRRKAKAKSKSVLQAQVDDGMLLEEILSEGTSGAGASNSAANDLDIVARMGISAIDHNQAFRDSPEERKLYEIGLTLVANRPDLRNVKANDIGKMVTKATKARGDGTAKRPKISEEVLSNPWAERFGKGKHRNAGKALVQLESDEEV